MTDHVSFMREAVQLAQDNRAKGAQPFGAVLTRDGKRIATGVNEIVQTCDPTSHAEMQAVRAASAVLKQPRLDGCVVYASGYPCPMCLAAMVNSGIEKVYYAFDNQDAAPYDMSSDAAYAALGLALEPTPLPMVRIDTEVTAAQMYGDAAAS
ncbi:MAG: nucleoside deaminase [Giesbergeria sp.]|nr:nucleoside deaminase [Giesbergeria sp.]MBP8091866.1 nucleoside deaminase [Giesbergeria sp.]